MTRVHIEFERVQAWLFSAPRLRAMAGANTLLGETLRVSLPDLARRNDRGWALAPLGEVYPAANPDDPLMAHDDPAADARAGVSSRDGGHFEAQFESGAEAFASEAGQLLRRELAGLRFRIWIDDGERLKSHVHLPTELPVLAPCEWTGRGLASAVVTQGNEPAAVSLDVAARHEGAKRAEEGKAKDLASMLSATTKLEQLKKPQRFEDLVGPDYLALIHADGNDVGGSRPHGDAASAVFFHQNRVLLRCAMQKAIDAICEGETGTAPLVPLMLGGDDLLLVCRAEIALPFVATLCRTLDELQRHDNGFKLTLGVGIVIAKHTIPINRLHEVAEQLAASAKRRFRGFSEDERQSVVDWAVYTTAWVDDPEDVRQRDWLRDEGQETRVLSQRPLNVLGTGLDSLQGLLGGAKKLEEAPRSQLRYVVDQLSRGRTLSELAFAELSEKARAALDQAGVKALWRPTANGGPWLTEVLDLVEIAEIGRLGRSADSQSAKEAVDG